MDTKEKERKRTAQRRPAPKSGRAGTQTKKAAPDQPKKRPAAAAKPAPTRSRSSTAVRKSAPVRQDEEKKTQRKTPAATRTRRSGESRSRREQEPKRVIPEVVYLPPKPFSRNRLVLRLATVAAVVLAVVLGVSVFFKVDTVVVFGNEKYTAYDIQQAAGIDIGDYLLTFSRARAAGKIRETLPYVENVRFGIKLPGTVNIVITEVDVTYSLEDSTGNWWLVNSAGRILEQIPIGAQVGHTQLTGIVLDAPQVGEQAVAVEDGEMIVDPEGNTVPPVVSAQQRLDTALDIAGYLELNSMIGKVVSVDVSALEDIRLTYGRKYQVLLGDHTQLSYKISVLRGAVAQLEQERPHSVGELNISDPDNVTYDDSE